MVYGGTVEVTVHVDLWGRAVVARIGSEYHVPTAVERMELWSPDIGAVVETWLGYEYGFCFRIVPIPGSC
jgi:hypothetical protein